MGMYDSFFFAEGVLPDNKEKPGHEFQTKCLNNNLDRYFVDKHGVVIRAEHECDHCRHSDGELINDSAYVYSHNFEKNPDGSIGKLIGYQGYKIVIVNSRIAFVEKLREENYDR